MGQSLLQEKLQHTFNYALHRNTIRDVPTDASIYIRAQEGTTTTSSIGHALTYDDRDNKFGPTKGFYISGAQEFAGIGGNNRYLKHTLKSSYYYSVAPKWVASVLGSGGYVFGLGGKDVRINDRFYLGGDDMRGFRTAGVGPRDTTTRDALGGNMYYSGTAELKFPLGLPDELGISGAAFTDVGSLWKTDDTGPTVFDNNKPRVSAGVGMLWTSPFGPIRVDFAHAIVKEKSDLTENIRFSFGTRF